MAADREVAEIVRWLKTARMKESRLGTLAAANPRAVARIRDGSAQIATLRAVLTYIREHPVKKK